MEQGQLNLEQPIDELNCKTNLIMDHRYGEQITQFLKKSYAIQNLNELAIDLTDDNIINKHRGTIGIRKILGSQIQSNAIQEVIDAGVIPKLISFAKSQEYPHLRLESVWAITNILSGDIHQCREVFRHGGISLFVKLLKVQKVKIFEKVVCGIGNISVTGIQYRDEVIRKGGIMRIIKFAKRFRNQKFLKLSCWTLSNLCRGDPLPTDKKVHKAVYFIINIVIKNMIKDRNVLGDCCWAICFHIKQIMDQKPQAIASLIPQLIKICETTSNIQIPILLAIRSVKIPASMTA